MGQREESAGVPERVMQMIERVDMNDLIAPSPGGSVASSDGFRAFTEQAWEENGPQVTVIQDDLWLCSGCLQAAVNDDYTELDYHYGTEESKKRMEEIQVGLSRLGSGLIMDSRELKANDNGYREFSRLPCDCCGSRLHGARFRFAILGRPQGGQR